MKIGLSSASFYPSINTEDTISMMHSLGFKEGEIFLNSLCEYEEDFINILLQEKEKYKFDVISVHAFGSPFEPHLFDPYKRRRKDLMKFFIAVCKAAKALGAKFYTFHGMRLGSFNEEDKEFFIEIYNELTYTASEIGITLSQENVSWCMSSMPKFLSFIKENCKYPLSFTLDFKQAYKANIDPFKYIDILTQSIGNIHINDKDKDNICLLPGKGNVDYNAMFSKLKSIGYKGDGIIEVYKSNYNNLKELETSKLYIKDISDRWFYT